LDNIVGVNDESIACDGLFTLGAGCGRPMTRNSERKYNAQKKQKVHKTD